jgi:hypothetical protein
LTDYMRHREMIRGQDRCNCRRYLVRRIAAIEDLMMAWRYYKIKHIYDTREFWLYLLTNVQGLRYKMICVKRCWHERRSSSRNRSNSWRKQVVLFWVILADQRAFRRALSCITWFFSVYSAIFIWPSNFESWPGMVSRVYAVPYAINRIRMSRVGQLAEYCKSLRFDSRIWLAQYLPIESLGGYGTRQAWMSQASGLATTRAGRWRLQRHQQQSLQSVRYWTRPMTEGKNGWRAQSPTGLQDVIFSCWHLISFSLSIS